MTCRSPNWVHRQVPAVLSPEEVARLIDAVCNLRRRSIPITLYSTRMHRAELCHHRPLPPSPIWRRPRFTKLKKDFVSAPITYSPCHKGSVSPRATPLNMATPAQISANRANAQRSTGPRSVEGKSVSRFNALKHGVDATVALPGEDPRAYEALAGAYNETYQPATATDRFLLDSMIRADWHKRRLQILEADLIRKHLAETPGSSLLDLMLDPSPAGKLLARIQRQIAAHERAWFRAHRELVRLISNVLAAQQNGFAPYFEPITPDSRPSGATPHLAKPHASESLERTQSPWPPVDEQGKPRYFVG
jgi:hypothetical protein